MRTKIFIISTLILGSFHIEAEENIFADQKIEQNFIQFTSVEIVNDFHKAIFEYNLKRKDPQSFAMEIQSPFYRTKFETGIKDKKELPEISKNEKGYIIKDGANIVSFDVELVLKNQFYLNGKLYSLETKNKNYNPKLFSLYLNKLLDFFVSQSIAEEDFVKDPASTRVLVASLIALDTQFSKIGLTCILSCKEKVSKINNAKLAEKINDYKNECEKNLEEQKVSYDPKNLKDISKVLRIGSSEVKKTYYLLKQMSAIQQNKDTSADKKIIGKHFEQDMSQNSCFDQIRNTYKMWITNAVMNTALKSELDEQAIETCRAITSLKSCLANFHSQSTMIYQNTHREFVHQTGYDEPAVPAVKGLSK